MRRVLACLAALALAGCGDAGTTDTPPPAASTSTPPSDREAADAVLADFVTAQGLTSHGSPADLIALALAVCDAYDRGVGVADVVASLEASGFDAYEAGQVNGAATATYCPEHEGAASGT